MATGPSSRVSSRVISTRKTSYAIASVYAVSGVHPHAAKSASTAALDRTLPEYASKYLIRRVAMVARCLRRQFDGEKVEGAPLQRGGRREQSCAVTAAETDGVAGQAGQVSQQRAEAGHRLAGLGQLCCRLALCRRRDRGWSNGAGALRRGCGAIMVIEQEGGKSASHVPFEIVGEQAQKDMGADPRLGPMKHRPDCEIDAFEAAKGMFDMGQALVGAHRVGGVELAG